MRKAVHKEYLEDSYSSGLCASEITQGDFQVWSQGCKNRMNFVRSLLQQCQQLEISFKYSHTSEGLRSLADVLSCTDKATAPTYLKLAKLEDQVPKKYKIIYDL